MSADVRHFLLVFYVAGAALVMTGEALVDWMEGSGNGWQLFVSALAGIWVTSIAVQAMSVERDEYEASDQACLDALVWFWSLGNTEMRRIYLDIGPSNEGFENYVAMRQAECAERRAEQ